MSLFQKQEHCIAAICLFALDVLRLQIFNNAAKIKKIFRFPFFFPKIMKNNDKKTFAPSRLCVKNKTKKTPCAHTRMHREPLLFLLYRCKNLHRVSQLGEV